MALTFVRLPVEIRTKIYTELLVLADPIVFELDLSPTWQTLLRCGTSGISPAILRVNRLVYHEAVRLLYSANRFRFPDIVNSSHSAVEYAFIAPFLTMIGSQAALIKHICINFPTIRYVEPRHGLHEAHIKNLELIRDACASIRTLELSLDVRSRKVDDSPTVAEVLQALVRRFGDIASLKNIVVNVDAYNDVGVSDTVVKWMRGYGWTVNMSQKEIYRGVQFDEYAVRMYQCRTSTPLSIQLALLRQIDRICIPAVVQKETPENVLHGW